MATAPHQSETQVSWTAEAYFADGTVQGRITVQAHPDDSAYAVLCHLFHNWRFAQAGALHAPYLNLAMALGRKGETLVPVAQIVAEFQAVKLERAA